MDKEKIEQLLATFYAGNTSEAEEKVLIDFFTIEASVPAEWENDRKLFVALKEMNERELPEGVSERLEQKIDQLASLPTTKRSMIRNLSLWGGSVAAAILVLVGVFVFEGKEPIPARMDTFDNPAEASKVATEALSLISMNLNKGLNQVETAQKDMDKVNARMNELLNLPE